MKKIFVTGGNGLIGSRTVHELVRKGYAVRCLLRPESKTTRIDGLEIERVYGDLRDPDSLERGMQGCDAVIHLAGISSWQEIRERADELEAVLVGGSENVVRAAESVGISRAVMVSSAAAINGSETPDVYNEKSRYKLGRSGLRYSQMKAKAERRVRTLARSFSLEVVTVNPCEVYGPEDLEKVTIGNLEGFLTPVFATVCVGGTSIAHVDDVASGIVLALEKGRGGQRYILGGENHTLAEIARGVRKQAGLSDRVVTVPKFLLKTLCEGAKCFGIAPPISLDVLQYATRYWFVDSSKARNELGYAFRSAEALFASVIPSLKGTSQTSDSFFSLRYGGANFDARTGLIKFMAKLQKTPVVVLRSNPKLCGEILAASDTKGEFLETLVATPAWHPIYSIESMDGERWEQLARDFKKVMGRLRWRERLPSLIAENRVALGEWMGADSTRVIDSERLARNVLRILYELLFDHKISERDETLFYEASIEWRKEISVKGRADGGVKARFWSRLGEIIAASSFRDGLATYASDPASWISVFAQPFLISPQINVGDIFVTVYSEFTKDGVFYDRVRGWAAAGDRHRIEGVVLESIRLKHPFPVLERQLKRDFSNGDVAYPAGTQVFILLDEFEQDQRFDPERWLAPASENPYHALPFAAGPRMCIGKPIALELLAELLIALVVDYPMARVVPGKGHLYSGRLNDHSHTPVEARFQALIFGRVLWRSFKIGRGKEAAGCPWKAASAFFSENSLRKML